MKRSRIILRIDATYDPLVQEGEAVTKGQRLCDAPETERECVSPVSGSVCSIHFDAEHHELVICISQKRAE